jgi:single-strand DNA-binding protein
MISAVISGIVGKDAETATLTSDTVTNFTVASRRFQDGQKQTDWVTVAFWGKRGQAIAQHITKGSRVTARGVLWVREYEHNGAKRWSLELRADDVELLGGPRKEGDDARF